MTPLISWVDTLLLVSIYRSSLLILIEMDSESKGQWEVERCTVLASITHMRARTHTGSVITAGRLHYSHSRSVKCCPGVSGRSMASTVSQSTQPCQTAPGSEVTQPDGPEGVAALRGWHHDSDPSIPRRGNGVLMPCWWRSSLPLRTIREKHTNTSVHMMHLHLTLLLQIYTCRCTLKERPERTIARPERVTFAVVHTHQRQACTLLIWLAVCLSDKCITDTHRYWSDAHMANHSLNFARLLRHFVNYDVSHTNHYN